MKCPRCRCDIPQGAIDCPECGKPLATFPVSLTTIQRQEKKFNPMWVVYGCSGCLFFSVATGFAALIIYILLAK